MAKVQLYRARAAAFFELARRYDGIRVEDEALIARVLRDRVEQSGAPVRAPAQPIQGAATTPERNPSGTEATPPFQNVSPKETPPAEVTPADHFVVRMGEKLIAGKTRGNVQDRAWDAKTVRQAQQTFRLFAKMLCEQQIHDVDQLKHSHFAALVDLFYGVAKSYGKSPEDGIRSCAELLSIGKTKIDSERGLAPETICRHLSHLQAWLDHAEGQGIELDRRINLSLIRPQLRGRARIKRGFFDIDHLSAIFRFRALPGVGDGRARRLTLSLDRMSYIGHCISCRCSYSTRWHDGRRSADC